MLQAYARLEKIRIEPKAISLAKGGEVKLKLVGVYSDGSTKTLNLKNAKLVISDFTIAKVVDSTKIKALTVGKAELRVSYQGFTTKAAITVTPKKK